jgi:hypothetical protein
MSATPPHSLDMPLLEPFLLFGASRRAEAVSSDARVRMKPFALAARARYRVALELRDGESNSAAFALLREAALLALYALEADNDALSGEARSHRATWDRFMAQERADAPGSLAEARIVLGTDDALAADSVAPSDAPALRAKAEESVAWLLSLAEVRSPKELARARIVRSSLFVVALVAVIWALLSYWTALAALSAR